MAGRATRAKLLEREHQLDGVEQAGDACELRRGQAAGEPDDLGPRNVDVHEQAGDLEVGQRHRLGRDLEIEAVRDEEAVDHVELGRGPAVHAHDDAVLDHELGLRVVRSVQRDETELRQRRHEQLAPELLRGARRETGGSAQTPTSLRSTYAAAASRTKAAVAAHPSPPAGRPILELGRRRAARPKRRVDLEQLVVGHAGELGGPIEVVGELPAARRAGDLGLPASVAGVARTSAATSVPARAASSVTSSSASPDGVSTRSGRREPSG